MPSPFTYGDSYGQVEGLNLSKDAARDQRYFQSLALMRQAQQDAIQNQLAERAFNQRAEENAANRDYTRQFDLANLGLRRQGAALDQAKFDWQKGAERPVDERLHAFDFKVAAQRAARGDFSTLPEVEVAHPKLSPSEQHDVLNASLEARRGEEQNFNFASNAASALKKKAALEGYLGMPDPSDTGLLGLSTPVAPGLAPAAANKRPSLLPFYEDLGRNTKYLDAIQKDKRFTDLLTPNPTSGEMEPTMQRPRWMTPTATGLKPLDRETAAAIFNRAGRDPIKARALAQQLGYEF